MSAPGVDAVKIRPRGDNPPAPLSPDNAANVSASVAPAPFYVLGREIAGGLTSYCSAIGDTFAPECALRFDTVHDLLVFRLPSMGVRWRLYRVDPEPGDATPERRRIIRTGELPSPSERLAFAVDCQEFGWFIRDLDHIKLDATLAHATLFEDAAKAVEVHDVLPYPTRVRRIAVTPAQPAAVRYAVTELK